MPPTESLEPDVTAGPESDTAVSETAGKERVGNKTVGESPEEGTGGFRTGIAIAGVLLLLCGGLIGYGVLDSEEKPKTAAVPTAEVTYEVTGEGRAEISYLARSEDGTATVEKGVTLPWTKTVRVPVGKSPAVAIVLGEKGGQAACTLAIRGEHVQRATATGAFGRATCTGELPAGDSEH